VFREDDIDDRSIQCVVLLLSFGSPFSVNKMFPALMSRCKMFLELRYASPLSVAVITAATWSSVSVMSNSSNTSLSDPPSQ